MRVSYKEVEKLCLPCGGTGVQILKSGLKIECPSCNGTGRRQPKLRW